MAAYIFKRLDVGGVANQAAGGVKDGTDQAQTAAPIITSAGGDGATAAKTLAEAGATAGANVVGGAVQVSCLTKFDNVWFSALRDFFSTGCWKWSRKGRREREYEN